MNTANPARAAIGAAVRARRESANLLQEQVGGGLAPDRGGATAAKRARRLELGLAPLPLELLPALAASLRVDPLALAVELTRAACSALGVALPPGVPGDTAALLAASTAALARSLGIDPTLVAEAMLNPGPAAELG